ncbi:MAG: hypothetical protein HC932_01885 [Thermales bacterium]|nr:hypothetical protein [Thermales bacterium]
MCSCEQGAVISHVDSWRPNVEERVPDEDGIGVNTTVFRRSNSRRVETESPEETRIRRLKFEELKKSVQKRILDSRF